MTSEQDGTVGDAVVPSDAQQLEVIGVREGSFGVSGTGDTSGFGGLTRPVVMPPPSAPPYGGWFDDVAEHLDAGVTGGIEKVVVDCGEITFHVARTHLLEAARHLRDDPTLRFELCSSLSGVHYPGDTGRELHVVTHLTSMSFRRRIRVETSVPDTDPHLPSITPVYPTADWHERETWDMFGIVFDGHPGLTRILMPDDWPGHPQRKDYPLGGIDVEFKGATIPSPEHRRRYS